MNRPFIVHSIGYVVKKITYAASSSARKTALGKPAGRAGAALECVQLAAPFSPASLLAGTHHFEFRELITVRPGGWISRKQACGRESGSKLHALQSFALGAHGSSQNRPMPGWFLARTRDEKPHRNAKYAYLCATRLCLRSAGQFPALTPIHPGVRAQFELGAAEAVPVLSLRGPVPQRGKL